MIITCFSISLHKKWQAPVKSRQSLNISGFHFAKSRLWLQWSCSLHLLFNSAVQIYEIQIFIISSSSFPGILPTINDQLSAGLLAQLVRALHRYKCVIRNLKQKKNQVKHSTLLQAKFVRSSTSPASSPVKFHSSLWNVYPPPVHQFVTPKVSDYPNKLRLGLGRFHLEPRDYSFTLISKFRSVQ